MGYLVTRGVFPIYREKTQAGLSITDRQAGSLYEARSPERIFSSFDGIPPLVVSTLLFVENRELLDPQRPRLNPAVEWYRLTKASASTSLASSAVRVSRSARALSRPRSRSSATPAEGRTRSPGEKVKQMLSASLRAYQGGTLTLPARRQIVVDYLNSTPLAAAPGFGEVLGLGDGSGPGMAYARGDDQTAVH
jgi:membrane peptidoglycan carboxypeptidase